jgi:hypothetical protein
MATSATAVVAVTLFGTDSQLVLHLKRGLSSVDVRPTC